MKLNIYAIRDEAGTEFGTPIFTDKDPAALASDYAKSIRNLDAQLEVLAPKSSEDTPKLPEQFMQLVSARAQLKDTIVYHVGYFETVTGAIEVLADRVLVLRVSEVM